MKEKLIKEIFDIDYPVSDKTYQLMLQLVDYKTFPKGKAFIQRHSSNTFEYFLLKGISRSYLMNPDGEEITINFFKGPKVLSPYITRTRNNQSLYFFEAVTEVEVAYLDAKLFENLMIENLEIRFFANTVLQNELIQKVNKEIGLASMTAKERLVAFREEFGGLENEIPHPMIASYLGITNISLSRLRRDLSND